MKRSLYRDLRLLFQLDGTNVVYVMIGKLTRGTTASQSHVIVYCFAAGFICAAIVYNSHPFHVIVDEVNRNVDQIVLNALSAVTKSIVNQYC